ncbi:hypothetical protein VTK26DRAFT_9179 [Humicola hyalothermophila]
MTLLVVCATVSRASPIACAPVNFIMSRESYEWLNKILVEYQPMQREYGRSNLKGTIMSKAGTIRVSTPSEASGDEP